jgi:hypothetical protein
MADRYWVGGSGTWNNTSTTNWSATSGGASGASAPTTADNVIFDANSNTGTGAFTVTVGTSAACGDFTTGGGGGALDGTMTLSVGSNLTVFGSMTLPATNFVVSGASTINFTATTTGKTVTTNGVNFGSVDIVFNGVGGGWSLGSALTQGSGTITLTAGSLNTANFNIVTGGIGSSNSNVRTLTLGSSTITLGNSLFSVSFGTITNLTFNVGTSTIVSTGTNTTLNWNSGLTWYDVVITRSTSTNPTGFNTTLNCRNLTINGPTVSSPGSYIRVELASGVSVNCSGTFSITASVDRATRTFFCSADIAAPNNTISAATYNFNDVNIRNCNFTGAGAPVTGTSIGDFGNCTGVTFTTPKTVYAVGGTGNWTATTRWATTSGGGASVNNYPLGQDTVIIDNNTGAAGTTLTLTTNAQMACSTLDCSARTLSLTIALNSQFFYMGGTNGGINVNANITMSGVSTINFQGAGTTTWTCPTSYNAGVRPYINARAAGAKFQLQNNWTSTTAQEWTLVAGTIDLNGFALTFPGQYLLTSAETKNLTYGTGGSFTITPNSGYISGIFNFSNATNYTWTGSGVLTYSGTGAFAVVSLVNNNTGLTETNAHNFVVSANMGANTFGQGSTNVRNWDLSGLTCGAFTYSSTFIFYGDVTLGANIASYVDSTATLTCGSTNATARTLTNAGPALPYNFTMDGVGGTFRLTSNLTFTTTNVTARTLTLTNGTIDLNGFVFTHARFSSTNSNVRNINFSTAGSQISLFGNGTTVFTTSNSTNLTYTGTNRFNFTYSGATGNRTITGSFTGAVAANNPNIYITAGTDTILFGTAYTRIVDFTGFSGTLGSTTWYVSQPTFSTGMSFATSGSTHTLFGYAGESFTVTTNNRTLKNRWEVNATSTTTFTLVGDFTIDNSTAGNYFSLLVGNFNLGSNQTVTAPIFSSTGSGVRNLTFGTGSKFAITGNAATVFNVGIATNFTVTGTSRMEFTYSGSTGTRTFSLGAAPVPSLRLHFYINAGTDTVTFSANSYGCGDVDFTGFSGTLSAGSSSGRTFTGNVTFSSGMTLTTTTNTTYFIAFTGLTSTITTNGKSLPFPIRIGDSNNGTQTGTVVLGDAMYISNGLSMSAGSFNTNSFNLTIDQAFNISTVDTSSSITFGSSVWTINGSGTAFSPSAAGASFTISGAATGQINFTSASAKTATPGDFSNMTWPRMCNAGAGALTVSGSCYVYSFKNLVSPATFTFQSARNYRVQTLEFLGTPGNLVTVGSTSLSAHTFIANNASTTISCNYMNISYSTGSTANGSVWYAGANSTDGGNNTNWIFQNAPVAGNQFLSFMNWA